MTAKLNRKWATRSKVASNNTALTEATNLYKRKTLQVPEAAPPTEVERRSKAFSAVGLDWFPVEVNWTSGRRTAYQLWHTALTLATGPQSGGGRRETVYPPAPWPRPLPHVDEQPTEAQNHSSVRENSPIEPDSDERSDFSGNQTFTFEWRKKQIPWSCDQPPPVTPATDNKSI